MRKSRAPLGASLIVLSSLMYAGYGIWLTVIGTYFGTFTQMTIRHLFTVLFLLTIALVFKKFQRIEWRRDAKWLVLSGISSSLVGAPMYYAVLHAGVSMAIAVMYVSIVIGMFFFGWLIAKERFTKDKWLSTLLGLAGLALIFWPSFHALGILALCAGVGSGLATGLNVVVSKKLPYNTWQTAVLVWTIGMFAQLPFIFIFGEHAPASGWHLEWLYLVIFAMTSVIGSASLIGGVKLIEAGAAGILGLLEPVFALFFGVLFFSERPAVMALFGVCAIVLAAGIPYLKDYNVRRGTLEEA